MRINTGIAGPVEFYENEKDKKRDTAKNQSVCFKGSFQISVKKSVHHSLASTPHTLQSGDFMEDALRHPFGFQRIDKEIE